MNYQSGAREAQERERIRMRLGSAYPVCEGVWWERETMVQPEEGFVAKLHVCGEQSHRVHEYDGHSLCSTCFHIAMEQVRVDGPRYGFKTIGEMFAYRDKLRVEEAYCREKWAEDDRGRPLTNRCGPRPGTQYLISGMDQFGNPTEEKVIVSEMQHAARGEGWPTPQFEGPVIGFSGEKGIAIQFPRDTHKTDLMAAIWEAYSRGEQPVFHFPRDTGKTAMRKRFSGTSMNDKIRETLEIRAAKLNGWRVAPGGKNAQEMPIPAGRELFAAYEKAHLKGDLSLAHEYALLICEEEKKRLDNKRKEALVGNCYDQCFIDDLFSDEKNMAPGRPQTYAVDQPRIDWDQVKHIWNSMPDFEWKGKGVRL